MKIHLIVKLQQFFHVKDNRIMIVPFKGEVIIFG